MEVIDTAKESIEDAKERRRNYIKMYKQIKKTEDEDQYKNLAKNYNKICYQRKNGMIDEKLAKQYGVLYPNYISIREELVNIRSILGSKDKTIIKQEILNMLEEIL